MKALFAILSVITSNLSSQAPDPKPYVEAMKRFDFMEGKWKGEGWVEMVPGQRRTFEQMELVEFKQGETILTIVGQGKDKKSGESAHDAFGVISFDASTGRYRMTSWAYPGRQGSFEITPGDNGFEWGMKNGPANIRYRMKLTAEAVWSETGEMSLDGQTWRKFIEFKVRKLK